ncbi:MAG TPA: M48 family metallopeptidase [Bacteroidales bacterium]|nr:M48 family metallopeptidase [Bacteroidales bacterium]
MQAILSKYSDKDFGTIVFKRSNRARRMNIKVFAERLEIILPYGFSEMDGMQFLNSIREKLRKQQTKVSQKSNSILITEEKPLQTLTFVVHVKKVERKDVFSSLKSGVLTIEYPDFLEEKDSKTQLYFWNSINYFLRKEAKRILPYRTYELAKKYGFIFSDVKIQSSKTRWGSCNQKKIINFSFYLLLLPQHLIDYVILHELCHTKEMNHSPKFWEWMDKVTDGKAENMRNELKKYAIPQ